MLDQADRYLNALASKYLFKCDKIQEAHDMMALFSKEPEVGKLNVHEQQTIWFEVHCGQSHYRQGEHRLALKQFQFIEKHINTIEEDCLEFNVYAIRKYSLNHYVQMIDIMENNFRGKVPTRCCLNMLRTISKISGYSEEQRKKEQASYEEYKKTDEFAAWEKEYAEREDDDMWRYDPDPQGWDVYFKVISEDSQMGYDIAKGVGHQNPTNGDIQSKCLRLFLRYDKADLALEMASNLAQHCAKHVKTQRALDEFVTYAKTAKFPPMVWEERDKFNAELLPAYEKAKLDPKTASSDMVYAHELVKRSADNASVALEALSKDSRAIFNVYTA